MKKKKILYVVNDSWFFKSHRLAIAKRMVGIGYDVFICAKKDNASCTFKDHGFRFIEWKLNPRGVGFISEIKAFINLLYVFMYVRPDIVHLVTIKAVLYGGIISRLIRTKHQVCAISGLGAILENQNIQRTILLPLYKFAVGHPRSKLIFQNPHNLRELKKITQMPLENSVLIRGSGVNLREFVYVPEFAGPKRVLLASRLLRDKGISEYLQAAEDISKLGKDVRFLLAGDDLGSGNPASYTLCELNRIKTSPYIEYLGNQDNIQDLLASVHIVVLPSYHEGLPKILQEAAACGRAVITSDAPGCVFAVEKDVTALVVPVKNVEKLKQAILFLLQQAEVRKEMGKRGRLLAERYFSAEDVVTKHVDLYRELTEY